MTEESPNVTDKLWTFFSSMKTGLALLGSIAIISGIGTLIPQEAQDPEKAKAVGRIWQTLGFTHLFSTPWFRLILGLLCLNLIVCSIQRFSGIWNLTFKPQIPFKTTNVPQKIGVEIMGETASLRHSVEKVLEGKGYLLKTQESDEGWGFHGVKHRWGYWGSFITHLAFVVLVIGALLGSAFGFIGYFMAGEGTMVPIQSIQVSKGRITQDFNIFINSAQDRTLPNGDRDNWYTDLSIIVKGKEVARQTLSVNHPFSYQGVTFYQSNFTNGARLTADIKGQKSKVILQNQGQNYFQAPGTDLYLIVADMSKDSRNPGIHYQVYKGTGLQPIQSGQLTTGQTADIQGSYKVTFEGNSGFTGLQVKKDPGVWLIWLGCFLLVGGLLLAFHWQPMVVSGIITQNGARGKLFLGLLPANTFLELKMSSRI